MPASGRFLLDTNIVIALLKGDEMVLSNADRASEVLTSTIVVGELFFGAAKSARASGQYLAGGAIRSTMGYSGNFEVALENLGGKGRPLPENDISLAASARHHGLILVTRDRHFEDVEDLQIADWALHPR